MEVTCSRDAGKAVKFFPGQLDRILYQTKDTEIPTRRVEVRNGSLMQNRPFKGERLAGRQTPFFPDLLLFLLPFVTGEESGKGHTAYSSSQPSAISRCVSIEQHVRRDFVS